MSNNAAGRSPPFAFWRALPYKPPGRWHPWRRRSQDGRRGGLRLFHHQECTMAQTYELTAELRDGVGKGAARAVRRQDKIPAVIYGDKKPPIPISLPQRQLTQRLHAGGFLTHIAMIDIEGEKIRVIPRDYQLDPVRDHLVHVDFLRVGEGARLTLEIPVHFMNEHASPGIK